ncbi:MAG TPA: hypothetical protein IAA75_08060, partial [Candidatus Pullichristensenella avicola]|nr:hypothetical protein [Candidatus Pullichristensenella avicola]
MARSRDNRPDLDYERLVEQHERFRSRHPQKRVAPPQAPAEPSAQESPARSATDAPETSASAAASRAAVVENAPAPAPEAQSAAPAVEAPAPADLPEADAPAVEDGGATAAFDDENYDDYDIVAEDEDAVEDEDSEEVNPNPFGTILTFLSRSKDAIGSRLHRRRDEDYEDYDADEESADEEETSDAPAPEAPQAAQEDDAPAQEEADALFDLPEETPPAVADVPEEAPAAVEQSVSIVAEDDGDEQADD